MSGQNAYQCDGCLSFGPCFLFSNGTPSICPNKQGHFTNWSLLVRGGK